MKSVQILKRLSTIKLILSVALFTPNIVFGSQPSPTSETSFQLYLIGEKKIMSEGVPDSLKNCKTFEKRIAGTILELQKGEYVYNDGVMEITNNHDFTIGRIHLYFRGKPRADSAFSRFEDDNGNTYRRNGNGPFTTDVDAVIAPNDTTTNASMQRRADLGLGYSDVTVLSLWAESITEKKCIEFFSEEELSALRQAEIAAEKLRLEKARLEEQRDKILNNCILDLLPSDAVKTYELSVLKKCKRISEQPSWWNKLMYDSLSN